MPILVPTLLDIAKANGSDALVGLIEETSRAVPEVTLCPARTIKGMNYKTLVRTALPTVVFRNANEGAANSKGTYENRMYETYILNPRWMSDKAVADVYEDGAEAYIAMEAAGIMEAAMQLLGTQFYYGTVGDGSKGFPGLIGGYDNTNNVVDAGGTTASTGSSCWGVRFGPKDVQWIWGANGQLSMSDVVMQSVVDGSGNMYTAYIQEILAHVGLQVGSLRSLGRIKKLTADAGCGLTDIKLGQLLTKFATGFPPDVILCSRRSLEQLRASRTATSVTGAPAPTPTEFEGIPIVPTDAIINTESLTL
ncbi:phage protein [soil metagenome]